MNEDNHQIGNLIAKLRMDKGWTQKQLANKLSVSDKTVSKWENNRGEPDKEFFPLLAEIFDISIDYLMTGKVHEKTTVINKLKKSDEKIMVMNKLELCAKEDDVDIFNEFSLSTIMKKDENKQTIFDYIKKYDSKKVYLELIKKFKPSTFFTSEFDISSDQILELMFKYDDVESLRAIAFFKDSSYRDSYGDIVKPKIIENNIYNQKNMEAMLKIVSNKNKIMDDVFSIHKNNTINNVADWQTLYTRILSNALVCNKLDIAETMMTIILEINKNSIDECEKKSKDVRYDEKENYRLAKKPSSTCGFNHSTIYNYAVVALPVNVLELLVAKGYFDEAKKFNYYNTIFKEETISTGKIESAIMLKNGQHSNNDIVITSCMEYGIVNIDKLLGYNDYKLIKYAFENYPICFGEMIKRMLSEKKYKELFMFGVDNKFNLIAEAVMRLDISEYGLSNLQNAVESAIKDVYKTGIFDINRKYFVNKNNNYSGARKTSQEVKEGILKELSLKIDKETLTKGLTEEYFNNLLETQNIELLVIKLCVRLEAILKCDFKYEGTFEEMLSTYTNKYGSEDDGWGYMVESNISKLLHKLRKYRNGIVHPEQTKESLDIKELEELIKFVIKLG